MIYIRFHLVFFFFFFRNRSLGNKTASVDRTRISNNTTTVNGLEYRHIAEIEVLLWRFRVEAGGYEYYTWSGLRDYEHITIGFGSLIFKYSYFIVQQQ
ncbi:hypothetical protein K501DRAFT_287107 [Backusella circina FSU 941]|nr:hypothetical protein K501DRAFT_287107 [Backusella circina FSU 941]